jgi:sucrose-6-phosphate hydrolase SacC (GH32 family)
LRTFPGGIRLVQRPITELQTLRKTAHQAPENTFEGRWAPGIKLSKNNYELEVEFENQDAVEFGLKLCVGDRQKTIVGYSVRDQQLYVDRRNSGLDSFIGLFKTVSAGPMASSNKTVKMHVFVDNSSIEVFGNDGETVLSSKIYPDPSSLGIELFSNQGKVTVRSLKVWELSPIATGLPE